MRLKESPAVVVMCQTMRAYGRSARVEHNFLYMDGTVYFQEPCLQQETGISASINKFNKVPNVPFDCIY